MPPRRHSGPYVPHDAKHIGMTATYFARWATKRGLTGPWSGPAAMRIV